MKKFLALIFSSTLILGACGSDDTSKNNSDTKSENKKDDKSKEEKKSQENEDKKEKKSEEKKKERKSKKDNQQQNNQKQQPQSEQTQQQNNPDTGMHYDPEYDKYGYTGMVDENGMPELDPNVNFNSHEGATPGEDYVPEDNANESNSSGPRSLREIKEDTGKGASEFTQAEIDEANAYAREH